MKQSAKNEPSKVVACPICIELSTDSPTLEDAFTETLFQVESLLWLLSQVRLSTDAGSLEIDTYTNAVRNTAKVGQMMLDAVALNISEQFKSLKNL